MLMEELLEFKLLHPNKVVVTEEAASAVAEAVIETEVASVEAEVASEVASAVAEAVIETEVASEEAEVASVEAEEASVAEEAAEVVLSLMITTELQRKEALLDLKELKRDSEYDFSLKNIIMYIIIHIYYILFIKPNSTIN